MVRTFSFTRFRRHEFGDGRCTRLRQDGYIRDELQVEDDAMLTSNLSDRAGKPIGVGAFIHKTCVCSSTTIVVAPVENEYILRVANDTGLDNARRLAIER